MIYIYYNKYYSKRNLEIFEKLLSKNIELDARQLYYYSRVLMYNSQYEKSISYFNIFLNIKDSV